MEIAPKYFDSIVVSGWQGDSFDEQNWPSSVITVRSPLPDFDKANYRKQFISTAVGLEVLKSQKVDYLVKVRTDQVLPEQAFRDICSRFDGPEKSNRLLLSDYVTGQLFYAGDFVFAGSMDVVSAWVQAVLGFGPKNIHPSIGADYVLKYLCATDPDFPKFLNPFIPAIIQTADPRNWRLRQYWQQTRRSRFDFLRRRDFSEISWRGELMREVVNVDGFSFREENDVVRERPLGGGPQPNLLTSFRTIWSAVRSELQMLEGVHRKPVRRQLLRGALKGEWSGS